MLDMPILDELIQLATAAGEVVKAVHFGSDMELEWKADETPLTKADRAVSALVMKFMAERFPYVPVIGEEGQLGQLNATTNQYWLLVDEVDGTWAFMLGVPVYSIMFALMRGGDVIRSVICDPIGQRMYSAEVGRGAFCNGKPISVHAQLPKVPSVGFCSWPHRNHPSDMLLPGMVSHVAVGLHDMGCIPVSMVTGGYLGALVASGSLSGMIFPGRTLHDIAAVDLLVREAGGEVTDLRGEPLWYGETEAFGYIASAGGVFHEKLLKLAKGAL